jgi:hypothetical protein
MYFILIEFSFSINANDSNRISTPFAINKLPTNNKLYWFLENTLGLSEFTFCVLNNLLSQRGGTRKTFSRLIFNLSKGSNKKGETILI